MKNQNKRKILLLVVLSLLVSSVLTALPVAAAEKDGDSLMLIPGGMIFGVQLQTKGVVVIALANITADGGECSPASEAGILPGDIIYEINGIPVNTCTGVVDLVARSQGEVLSVSVMRRNKKMTKKLTPALSKEDGVYKAGICIRDNTAGIGTVTFINEEELTFAGLGHGICDSDTGVLMPLLKANVCEVTVTGVKKGRCGIPGEIRGYFAGEKTGSLIGNTPAGVYGRLDALPEGLMPAIPVGSSEEIQTGKAYILSAVDDGRVEKYEIKITRIADKRAESKNFVIEVTDKRLLDITEGIVQGMSGSPIIQNGKLVGAVTHVMINDPHRGYGIFIENMLNASQMPLAKAS